MNKEEVRRLSGLVFIASTFIGAGIGLLFGRPDVGGCMGMGVGFLLMGFVRAKEAKSNLTVSILKWFGAVCVSIAGALLLFIGIGLLFFPIAIWPYIAGIAALAFGLLLLAVGILKLKR